MLIEIDADQLHVSGLGLSDEVAGAAQIEVPRADLEAGAQSIEGVQRTQSLDRRFRQLGAWLGEQNDLAAPPPASDTAPQLVKQREAEPVGAPHDHRVRARDV